MSNETLIDAQARAILEAVHLLRMRMSKNAQDAGVDLTMPQAMCLMKIRESGQVSIKDLSEELRVSPPSASTMVDRLVEMGKVSREQSTRDRREVVVRTTEQGVQTLDAMESMILSGIKRLLLKVGEDCAQKWCEVYEQIQEALVTEPDALDFRQNKETPPK